MHVRRYIREAFRDLALSVPALDGQVKFARAIPRDADDGPVCAVVILEDRPENEAMGGVEIRIISIAFGIAAKGDDVEDLLDEISLALEAAVVAWGLEEVRAGRIYRADLDRTGFQPGGGSDEIVGMDMIYSVAVCLTEDAPVIANP